MMQGIEWTAMPPGLQDRVEKMLARAAGVRIGQIQQVRDKGRHLSNHLRPTFTSFTLVDGDDRNQVCPHIMRVPVYQGGRRATLLLQLSKIPYLRAWAQFSVYKDVMKALEKEGLSYQDFLGLIPQIFHCTFGACAVLEVEAEGEVYIPMGIRCTATAGGFSDSKYCMPPGGYCNLAEDPFHTAWRESTEETTGLRGISFVMDEVCGVKLFADEPNTTFAVRATAKVARLPKLKGNWEVKGKRMAWIRRSAALKDLRYDNRDLVQAFRSSGFPDVSSNLIIAPDVAASMRELYHGLGLYTP
jgi:hypothetical protein